MVYQIFWLPQGCFLLTPFTTLIQPDFHYLMGGNLYKLSTFWCFFIALPLINVSGLDMHGILFLILRAIPKSRLSIFQQMSGFRPSYANLYRSSIYICIAVIILRSNINLYWNLHHLPVVPSYKWLFNPLTPFERTIDLPQPHQLTNVNLVK